MKMQDQKIKNKPVNARIVPTAIAKKNLDTLGCRTFLADSVHIDGRRFVNTIVFR